MQCFKIPKTVCGEIDRLCAGFWWGDKEDVRRIHWARWSILCRPKEKGGMGFRDIRSFNQALLAKQAWRLLENPQSLAARVLRARYFKDGNLLGAMVKSDASFVWRSIAWSRPLIEKGMGWKIGNGEKVRLFYDQWVAGPVGVKLGMREREDAANMCVNEVITADGGWDTVLLEALLLPYEVDRVLRTPIGEHGEVDEMRWRFEEKGLFTVKSAYLVEIGYYEGEPNSSLNDRKWWNKMVWSLNIPPKARIFLWRALMDFIPTATNLRSHHVPTEETCGLCHGRWGSTEHCVFFRPKLGNLWKKSRFWPVKRRSEGLTTKDIAWVVREECDQDSYELWAVMAWQAWSFVCSSNPQRS